jgi:hypothetical protein
MEKDTTIKDIERQIAVVNDSIAWAEKYYPSATFIEDFKSKRRQLKKIHFALEENCSAAAYGESQVGKSYLMSSLLSTNKDQLRISDGAGGVFSFIDDMNPSGGNTSKEESTGVITRFTAHTDNEKMKNYVKIRTLSIVDIILFLSDAYYKDVKINTSTVLDKNEINEQLSQALITLKGTTPQYFISEDDIYDIQDYFSSLIGNNAVNVINSNFCKEVSPVIKYVAVENWGAIFSLLWNRNEKITELFNSIIKEFEKLNFEPIIYVPFDAVLRNKGTILSVSWLDSVCDKKRLPSENVECTSKVYDPDGNVLDAEFSKAYLSALTAELTFVLPDGVQDSKPFLQKLDLLDFPGARRRESIHEENVGKELSNMLRRGKVAYLFNKYSRSLRINVVLFCQHQDMTGQSEIGESLNDWILENVGDSPEKRGTYIKSTNGVSPFFIIATKFNTDLKWTNEIEGKSQLSDRWKTRFLKTLSDEVVKPKTYSWFDNWVDPSAGFNSEKFQSIYMLRDFFWSRDQQIFSGYKEGVSDEIEEVIPEEYPAYREHLKRSFTDLPFVKAHFADPEKAWNDAATLNNDGSKAIIDDLSSISSSLDDARYKKYFGELQAIKSSVKSKLVAYHIPEDQVNKKNYAKRVAGEVRLSLDFLFGKDSSALGKIINEFMVHPVEIRKIVYSIVELHSDVPVDMSAINMIRLNAAIMPDDSREVALQKLVDYYGLEEQLLADNFQAQGIELADIVEGNENIPTTWADVIMLHISQLWFDRLNQAVSHLEGKVNHADRIAVMLQVLYSQLGLKAFLTDKVANYLSAFDTALQPNVIADCAAVMLNNFVATVGRDFMTPEHQAKALENAQELNIKVDVNEPPASEVDMTLSESLDAFDMSSRIMQGAGYTMNDVATLRRLPWWDNFMRWKNRVMVGLMLISEVPSYDKEANSRLKEIIDKCDTLYQ